MTGQDQHAARRGLREKIAEASNHLDRVLKQRGGVQAAIERARRNLADLGQQENQLGAEEGTLRAQLADLKRALEAFEPR